MDNEFVMCHFSSSILALVPLHIPILLVFCHMFNCIYMCMYSESHPIPMCLFPYLHLTHSQLFVIPCYHIFLQI